MFFKQVLKNITGVKLLNNIRDELNHITNCKNDFFASDTGQYNAWEELATTTYRAIDAVEDAFQNTKHSTDQRAWLTTYHLAHKADLEIKKLLQFKLNRYLMSRDNTSSTLYYATLAIFMMKIPLIMKVLKQNEFTTSQIKVLMLGLTWLLLTPKIASIVMAENESYLEKMLSESNWCATVLATAQESGITIDLTRPQIKKPSNTFMREEINNVDFELSMR